MHFRQQGSRVRQLLAGASFLALLIWGGAAAFAETREFSWREQTRLSTGEAIVVERVEKRILVEEPGHPPGWLFDEAWLKARLPSVGETEWHGAVSPLVLDVTSGGDWYLLGIVESYRGQMDYQLPDRKLYVTFKLDRGSWHRIPFGRFPSELQPNLLGDTYSLFIEREYPNGALVGFRLKAEVDSVPTLGSEYKRIDRALGQ